MNNKFVKLDKVVWSECDMLPCKIDRTSPLNGTVFSISNMGRDLEHIMVFYNNELISKDKYDKLMNIDRNLKLLSKE